MDFKGFGPFFRSIEALRKELKMESYYEVPEMARLLGVKEFTVQLWCRTKKLPAIWYKPTSKYGKWIVEIREFEKILEGLTTKGTMI